MERLFLLGLTIFLIGYILSPLDAIPDFIPFLGRIDDIVVPLILFWWFKKKFNPGKKKNRRINEQKNQSNEIRRENDPYAVLNISRQASETEIKQAYKEMVSKYHPDKVAHLGEELKALAHDKIIEINKAYKELERK